MNKKIKNMIFIELGILLLVLIIYISIQIGLIDIIPKCVVNTNFHILCPSCGGTRCVISFLNGNFYESYLYHPIFFVMIIYLIVVNAIFIINSFREKELATFLYPKNKFWIVFIIILMIFTIYRNII